MKKIRSVSISSKKFPSGKYIKLIIVFLMSALVIMALILIKVYFDVNKKNMEKESSNNNITMQNYGSYQGFEVFEDENGLLGVVNNDRVIIDAAWENVFILSENRFIVGKRIADTKKMGIIDFSLIFFIYFFSFFLSIFIPRIFCFRIAIIVQVRVYFLIFTFLLTPFVFRSF